MSEIARIIGARVRQYRNQSGLSQEELAEKAGLHSTYIGQLERGEKNATLETVGKVAVALNLSFEVLFENIITGSVENKNAQECYEILASLSIKEQKAVLEIVKRIVDYKGL